MSNKGCLKTVHYNFIEVFARKLMHFFYLNGKHLELKKQSKKTVIKLVHNNVIKNVISYFMKIFCIPNKRDFKLEEHYRVEGFYDWLKSKNFYRDWLRSLNH